MYRPENLLPIVSLANWESLIFCTGINHTHYRSPHAFDSRGNKKKTKPQRVFMMEHAVYVSLYFKPCSGTLFVRVNAQVFWLITLPLYHFSSSLCISGLPQQLLCPLSQLSLLPLSISLARSINTMTNLAVSLRGDFATRRSFAEIQPRHGNCAKKKRSVYHSISVTWLLGKLSLMNITRVISWKCQRG